MFFGKRGLRRLYRGNSRRDGSLICPKLANKKLIIPENAKKMSHSSPGHSSPGVTSSWESLTSSGVDRRFLFHPLYMSDVQQVILAGKSL